MKGVGEVPNWFGGRPASAKLCMPCARSGFSYNYVHLLHPKPDLKRSVPGPVHIDQLAFVPTRNALWNKPVSYNANSFAQKSSSTYATQEPRLDQYLTLNGGAHLAPYKRGMGLEAKLTVNVQRAPHMQEEAIALAGRITHVAPLLSALQKKRLKSARAAPRTNNAVTEKPPLSRRPWSSMVISSVDPTISDMALMGVKYDLLTALPGAGRSLQPRQQGLTAPPRQLSRPASASSARRSASGREPPARCLSAVQKSFVSKRFASELNSYSPHLALT